MPQKLLDIFNDKTDPRERFKKLSSCGYQGQDLDAAESFTIYPNSVRVPDGEGLARSMESPSHVDAATRLYTGIAFSEATKRGISVQRISITTDREIHDFGKAKVADHNKNFPEKKRAYLGYVVGLCSVFRNAKSHEGLRLFGVFSTPEPEIPAHADIFVVLKPGPAEKLAIQRVFHDAFNLDELITP
ncbi:hypothetical protein F0170_07455 [Pseudomonas sp. MAFF 730085]|uniref:Uncharacterized protein n=1 Tax=Pseudomonas kitaguniensis TaxID=2607908 RepID=A0A5N7JR01_9PSED|nr:hypothetical protein [Pseudomonas kitaguniensis]MPQ83834.1 hypothetical protein [Pseudomonas kitaguniensis]